MGCGQSHIAVIYPRKGKGKASSNSGVGSDESDEEGGGTNQAENGSGGGGGGGGGGSVVGIANPIPTDDQDPNDPCAEDDEASSRLRQMVHLSNSPLLAQAELSSSQNDFFKMLDEKINNGPDYDESGEYELALDHAQLCRFLQEWQAAKARSRNQAPAKLQRYHTLQNNGEPAGGHTHQLASQTQQQHPPNISSRQQLPPQQQQQQQLQQQHKLHSQSSLYQPTSNATMVPAQTAPAYNSYQPQYDHYQSFRQYHPLHHQGSVQQQYHAAAQYHAQYQVANSVVLYDKSRGGYYTELA
ncbi:uncharacterized protein isoform X2 [Rhodnius prolixus]|uniref:uncharacterized protein isoform X2 n=1 Tax=Rhodnius prolixus TaxID=13249 RepID=UPI003D18EEA5